MTDCLSAPLNLHCAGVTLLHCIEHTAICDAPLLLLVKKKLEVLGTGYHYILTT